MLQFNPFSGLLEFVKNSLFDKITNIIPAGCTLKIKENEAFLAPSDFIIEGAVEIEGALELM